MISFNLITNSGGHHIMITSFFKIFGGCKNREEISGHSLQYFFDQDESAREIERSESPTTEFLFHFFKKVVLRYLFDYGFS